MAYRAHLKTYFSDEHWLVPTPEWAPRLKGVSPWSLILKKGSIYLR